MTELYHYISGKLPILLNIPHAGTFVPTEILKRFTPQAKELPDTDWHVEKLYAFARELGIHMLIATHSRYVIDLNRASNDEVLYPGKFTTSLCPTTLFNSAPIYQKGLELDKSEILNRINQYWIPYHDRLQSILNEMKQYKRIVLFDAHSICSKVPNLFDGILPDLNIGTADGVSADQELAQRIMNCAKRSTYSSIYNGRFKGGYITRHYGQPTRGINAIQLELAQKNYMQETYPFVYEHTKAHELQMTLREILNVIVKWVGYG